MAKAAKDNPNAAVKDVNTSIPKISKPSKDSGGTSKSSVNASKSRFRQTIA